VGTGIDLKTVEIDPKGRVVIPKEVREQSGITAPGELVVTVEGDGKIILQSAETSLKRAQDIGRRKLRTWAEGKHEEDKLAHQLAREEERD
jgi:AbrB family looped-hinge helix DNA binding protein